LQQDAARDLSFIPATLTRINNALIGADAAARKHDRAKENAELLDAASEALVALQKLSSHPLWEMLHHDQQRRLQQWEGVALPVIDQLFVELGYHPPPPALTLIDLRSTDLRRAVGIRDLEGPDTIVAAREVIARLHQVLDKLMQAMRQHARFKNALKSAIGVAAGALAKTLGTVIALPAAETEFRELTPHAVELLNQLRGQASLILPSLPMALVASISDDITRWFHGPVAPTIRSAFRLPPVESSS
jgi:hypothetical protein